MTARWGRLFFLLIIVIALVPAQSAQAARGVPGSLEFGYGAALHLDGAYLDQATYLAASLRLDWLSIDLSWGVFEPTAGQQSATWTQLDQVMQVSARNKIPVLIRLTSAPAWAITSQGPSPELTLQFIQQLLSRYPGAVQAVELFPSANVQAFWGASPDPAAYAALFASVYDSLQVQGSGLLLVAAGLRPVSPGLPAGII